MNFGTNPDHAQNSMTNVGLRTIEYGDKLRLFKSWRKRGLTTLVRIMSYMPTEQEAQSEIYGNDRLEFLGDAVLEFVVRHASRMDILLARVFYLRYEIKLLLG